jgi:protein-S-isoprenylcysteine O-methyltransferase Ste14
MTWMDLTAEPAEAVPTSAADPEIIAAPGPDIADIQIGVAVGTFRLGSRFRAQGQLSGFYAMTAYVVFAAVLTAIVMARVVLPADASNAERLTVAGASGAVVLIVGIAVLLFAHRTRFKSIRKD